MTVDLAVQPGGQFIDLNYLHNIRDQEAQRVDGNHGRQLSLLSMDLVLLSTFSDA